MNHLLARVAVEESPTSNFAPEPSPTVATGPASSESATPPFEPIIDERTRRRIYYRALSHFLSEISLSSVTSTSPMGGEKAPA